MTDHRGAAPPENSPAALPSPTVWPCALATGVTLAAAGVLTSPLLVAVGGLLAVVSLARWVLELTDEAGRS